LPEKHSKDSMQYKPGFKPAGCGGVVKRRYCDFSALIYETRRRGYLQLATRLTELLGQSWCVRLEPSAEQGLLAIHTPMFLAIEIKGERQAVVPLTVNTRGNKLVILLPGVKRKAVASLGDLATWIVGLVRLGKAPSLREYIEARKQRRLEINKRRGQRPKKKKEES